MTEAERRAEWMAEAKEALRQGKCPDSGLRLTTHGNVQIPAGTMSCEVCDCFGYCPEDVG